MFISIVTRYGGERFRERGDHHYREEVWPEIHADRGHRWRVSNTSRLSKMTTCLLFLGYRLFYETNSELTIFFSSLL